MTRERYAESFAAVVGGGPVALGAGFFTRGKFDSFRGGLSGASVGLFAALFACGAAARALWVLLRAFRGFSVFASPFGITLVGVALSELVDVALAASRGLAITLPFHDLTSGRAIAASSNFFLIALAIILRANFGERPNVPPESKPTLLFELTDLQSLEVVVMVGDIPREEARLEPSASFGERGTEKELEIIQRRAVHIHSVQGFLESILQRGPEVNPQFLERFLNEPKGPLQRLRHVHRIEVIQRANHLGPPLRSDATAYGSTEPVGAPIPFVDGPELATVRFQRVCLARHSVFQCSIIELAEVADTDPVWRRLVDVFRAIREDGHAICESIC